MSEQEVQTFLDNLSTLDALVYSDGYVDAVFCDGTWEKLN